MAIMGIDYSTTRYGVAVMSMQGNLVDYYTAILTGDHKQRRQEIVRVTRKMSKIYGVDAVVLESVRLFSKSQISFATIFRLVGVVLAIVDGLDAPVYAIDTRAWKKRVLGSAKATKEDAVSHAKQFYGVDANHDLADAICIAESAFKPDARKLMKRVL